MKNKYLKLALIAITAILLISAIINIDDIIRGFNDGISGK